MTPASYLTRPSTPRPTTCFISRRRKASTCAEGFRGPVTSTTASSPIRSSAPVGSQSRAIQPC